ncbi:hypothetical protein M6B38_164340 [Iris pallida]|uniref:Uncharacterized protein n=1 Tax=Iris pallida TaxID=29817 RepID=A0AAX6E809_IRIPA|nr:hypothetical protein M6B38_204600 [Iris pallida]KAJ6808559.1 hypothetical protein M6B38_164340 [Iris pallida]
MDKAGRRSVESCHRGRWCRSARHRRRRRLGWRRKPVLTGGVALDGERARAPDLRRGAVLRSAR